MPNIEIKKRVPNIVTGLIFGMLAIWISPSGWAYPLYVFSTLCFVFADEVIRYLSVDVHDTIKLKEGLELEIKNSDGSIAGKYKSPQ